MVTAMLQLEEEKSVHSDIFNLTSSQFDLLLMVHCWQI